MLLSLLLVHLYLDMDVSHPCDFFLPLKELEGLIKYQHPFIRFYYE